MMKCALSAVIISVLFTLRGCSLFSGPDWRVAVSKAYFVDSVEDSSQPDSTVVAKEGLQFLLVRVSVENLRNRSNSFDPKKIVLHDSIGTKYTIVGTVVSGTVKKPQMLLGYMLSQPGKGGKSVGPMQTESNNAFTTYVFAVSKSSTGLKLQFPDAQPVDVNPRPKWY